MTKPIPYTQSSFDTILKNSRVFHNNQEVNPAGMNFNITGTDANGAAFIQSFVADLDMFIQSNLYDVDIREKVKNYIAAQMLKWGRFLKKNMIGAFMNIDAQYAHIFKERDFIQGLLIPYLYENTMITENIYG